MKFKAVRGGTDQLYLSLSIYIYIYTERGRDGEREEEVVVIEERTVTNVWWEKRVGGRFEWANGVTVSM